MFVSAKQLVRDYGIDDKIARFFVDREPPADNLYWHEKLLYLRPAAGYLFIPLIVDLLAKGGIDREHLLAEEFVSVMESVGHITALEEIKKISDEEAIIKCAELVKDVSKNQEWLDNVVSYLSGNNDNLFSRLTTPFKALHRGDVFLFCLTTRQFPVSLFESVAKQWFALITTLLLIDDAEDLESDKEKGEDNAFIESGLDADGVNRLTLLIQQNRQTIQTLNAVMAAELGRQAQEKFQSPKILELLKQSI